MRWVLVFGLVLALVTGSAHISYYGQAIHGQLSILFNARPIDDYIADPLVDEQLKQKLAKVKEIREFAVRELGLPDNDSYRKYVDIKRPYVVWNVIATPELSMRPIEWCFPVAGCVSYRGYYDKEEALSYAKSLQQAGYDVHVAEVPAYSTLGWFSDPVISTFIHYSETQLARLIFHELAHQVLYTKNDSQFNESFAVAIEEEGVRRWIAKHGNEDMNQAYVKYEDRKKDFLGLLFKYQKRLADNYARDVSQNEKRTGKAKIFQALRDEFQGLKVTWNGYAGYDRWFSQPLTNAHLASIATYHNFVPGFRALMARQSDFPAFYVTAKSLAALPKPLRDKQLALLGKDATLPGPVKRLKTGQDPTLLVQHPGR